VGRSMRPVTQYTEMIQTSIGDYIKCHNFLDRCTWLIQCLTVENLCNLKYYCFVVFLQLFVLEELFIMELAEKTIVLTRYFTEVDPAEVMQMVPVNLQKNVSTVKVDSMLLPGIVEV